MALSFPYRPNWAEPVRMTRAYKTDIVTARDFTETRVEQRENPYRTMEFSALMSGSRETDMHDYLVEKIQADYWVPDLTRHLRTAAEVAALTDIVTFEGGIPRWATIGGRLYFESGTQTAEYVIAQIDFDEQEIQLSTATAIDWPAGTRVRPMMYGRVQQETNFRWLTNEVATADFVFEEDPGLSIYPDRYVYVDPDRIFQSREVWLGRPNWREAVDEKVVGYLKTMNLGRGRFSHQSRRDENTFVIEHRYTARSQEQATDLISFFTRHNGRRGEFWLPTWRRDMEPNAILTVYDEEEEDVPTGLIVSGRKVYDRFNGSRLTSRIMVVTTSGEKHFFEVVEMVVNEAEDVELTLDTAPDFTLDEIERVCWMHLCRFATDTLETEFLTDGLAEMNMVFQNLNIGPAGTINSYINGPGGPGGPPYAPPGYPVYSNPLPWYEPPSSEGAFIGVTWSATVDGNNPNTLTFSMNFRVRFYGALPDGSINLSNQIGPTKNIYAGFEDETFDGNGYLEGLLSVPVGTHYIQIQWIITRLFPLFTWVSQETRRPTFYLGI